MGIINAFKDANTVRTSRKFDEHNGEEISIEDIQRTYVSAPRDIFERRTSNHHDDSIECPVTRST